MSETPEHPRITICPGQRGGAPCIDGIRIPAELVAETVAIEGVEHLCDNYNLNRAQALVCCWYVAEYRGRTKLGKHLQQWVAESAYYLWKGHYWEVKDPPGWPDETP